MKITRGGRVEITRGGRERYTHMMQVKKNNAQKARENNAQRARTRTLAKEVKEKEMRARANVARGRARQNNTREKIQV